MPDLLSAAVLIGGRARRLEGRVKPLLQVGGRTILDRQRDALRAAGVEHIVLIGRWPVEDRPSLPVCADAVEQDGALAGLYTALLVAPGDRTLVLAADLPFVSPALLRELMTLSRHEDAVVARTADGLHPLCGCYHRRAAAVMKRRLDRGELAIRGTLEHLRVRTLAPARMSTIDPDGMMLMNINTLADYERACEAARRDA